MDNFEELDTATKSKEPANDFTEDNVHVNNNNLFCDGSCFPDYGSIEIKFRNVGVANISNKNVSLNTRRENDQTLILKSYYPVVSHTGTITAHQNRINDGNVSDSEREFYEDDRIDCNPSPKERAKTISQFFAKSYMFLNGMEWNKHENFASKISAKKHKMDLLALAVIAKADRYGYIGNPIVGLEKLEIVTELIKSVDLPQEVMIRYLTSKSYMLKMKGKGAESESLITQAVQLAANEHVSGLTAYCLSKYSAVTLLHDIDPDGTVNIPGDHIWRQAELFCLQACEQHQRWVEDMDDDFDIPESVTKGFFLMNFIRYVAILLRSCIGSGFEYFDEHVMPKENLTQAAACIERIKAMDHLLSTKSLMQFLLVECDYYLRYASLQESKSPNQIVECYEQAKGFANKAKTVIATYRDRRMAKYHGSFPAARFKYIKSKLKELKHECTTDSSQDSDEGLFLSYVDYIKDGTDGKVGEIYIKKDMAYPKRIDTRNPRPNAHGNHSNVCPAFVMIQNTIPKQANPNLPFRNPQSPSVTSDDLQTVPKVHGCTYRR